MDARSNTYDEATAGEALGMVAGIGILLTQAAVVIPGLLPALILLLPFVLPLVVLGLVGAIVVGIPYALWRLSVRIVRRLFGVRRPVDRERRSPMQTVPRPS